MSKILFSLIRRLVDLPGAAFGGRPRGRKPSAAGRIWLPELL